MANVQHSSLTDPELHEPKGVASAASGEVYVADGASSGSWSLGEEIEVTKDFTASSGHIKLPGGLILQWGNFTSPSAGGIANITFDIPFTTACFSAVCLRVAAGSTGDGDTARVRSLSTTTVSFATANSAQYTFIAVGH